MTIFADELTRFRPSLWTWQIYDPTGKAELYSTAILSRHSLHFGDPVLVPC